MRDANNVSSSSVTASVIKNVYIAFNISSLDGCRRRLRNIQCIILYHLYIFGGKTQKRVWNWAKRAAKTCWRLWIVYIIFIFCLFLLLTFSHRTPFLYYIFILFTCRFMCCNNKNNILYTHITLCKWDVWMNESCVSSTLN